MPLLEPDTERIHVLYTHGPNPGVRSIFVKSANLTALEFPSGPGVPLIAAPGAEMNDVTWFARTLDGRPRCARAGLRRSAPAVLLVPPCR